MDMTCDCGADLRPCAKCGELICLDCSPPYRDDDIPEDYCEDCLPDYRKTPMDNPHRINHTKALRTNV